MKYDLTKDEAFAVAEFIDLHLIQAIREDEDIDSMLWLRNMMNAYEKLALYGGYEGMSFPSKPKEENE